MTRKTDLLRCGLTLVAMSVAVAAALPLHAVHAEDTKLVKVVGGRFPTSTYARKHLFPGTGDYKLWEQADKLYVDAGKLDDKGRSRPAADKYAEAISIYPYDMNFFNNYGLMLLKLRDELGAEAAWRHAISGKAHFWQAQNNLGRMLFFQKRLAEAKYVWSKALESEPPSEVRQDITANVLLCNQRIEKLRSPAPAKQQPTEQPQEGGQSYTTGTAPGGSNGNANGTQSYTTGITSPDGTQSYTTGTNYPDAYTTGSTTHPDGTQTFTTGGTQTFTTGGADTLPPAPSNGPQ